MRADPDEVSIPLDKDVLRGATPPRYVLVDLAIPWRNEPGDLFGTGGIGNVKNAHACVEPGHRDDIRFGGAGLQPAMCVVRAESSASEAEIRVGSVGRSRGARKKADNLWIPRILHIDDVGSVIIL